MFRPLTSKDLPRMVDICNLAMPRDQISESIIFEKTFGSCDYLPELCLGFESSTGKIEGFINGTIFNIGGVLRGGIRLLATDPSSQRNGIASNLLEQVQAHFLNVELLKQIWVLGIPGNYLTPGVDPLYINSTCFLEKHNYKRIDTTQNLLCQVRPRPRTLQIHLRMLEAQGYQLYRATYKDKKRILDFISSNFEIFREEVTNAFLNQPITVHLCLFNGEIIGFGLAEANNRGTGTAGPLAVLKTHRRKGIIKVLMELIIYDLSQLGFTKCILPWTNPVLDYYFSTELNAQRDRIFWLYAKDL